MPLGGWRGGAGSGISAAMRATTETGGNAAAVPSAMLITVLVLVTAIGPFAIQVFIPALPVVQVAFGASAAETQLAFSLSTLAIALAMLVYGPLSDRIGRRPALLGGLVIYLAGTVLCAIAISLPMLIAGRIVQAAGGCAGIVLSRAIVRDLFSREDSAQILAYVTMAMVVAPMLAPALGGIVVDLAGWRWIFAGSILLGGAALLATLGSLRETRVLSTEAANTGMLEAFGYLLRQRAFLGYAMQAAFSMGVFYGFLAAAPYLMIEVYQRPASEYGLLFVMVSGSFMAGNFLAARISRRIGSARMVLVGSAGALAGALLGLGLALLGVWTPLALFLPTAVGAFSQGVSMPNVQAAMVSVAPHLAGSAAGLGGCLQMAGGALAAQIIGSIQNGTPYPVTIGMAICAAGALLAAMSAGPRRH